MKNDEFWRLVELYKIENQFPNIPPSVALVLLGTQTMIMTHKMNQIENVQIEPETKPEE